MFDIIYIMNEYISFFLNFFIGILNMFENKNVIAPQYSRTVTHVHTTFGRTANLILLRVS